MMRHYVSSSVIRWYGFEPQSRTLEIEFQSGHVYRYDGVPPETAAALDEAGSKGRFFDYYIREHFPAQRLR